MKDKLEIPFVFSKYQIFDVLIDEEEYVGYLGLDFFKDKKFCVDLDKKIISLE